MKILIVKLSSLGDLFHALPAVHGLKVGLEADIDWVTQPEYAELAGCFVDVSRVIPFPRRRFVSGGASFLRELRQVRYDLVVDLQGLLKSAFVTFCARGRLRIGPSYYREGSRLFYNAVAGPRNKARHAVEENLDVLSHLGLPTPEITFPVTFPPALLDGGHPRIGIAPVSRWESKNWPLERYVELARALITTRQATLYLLGSPGDVPVCRRMAEALDGTVVNLAGQTSLREMGGVLNELDLLVANDSGPVHMAVAAGTPTVVVFGPTFHDRTGPYGPTHTVVQAVRPRPGERCSRTDTRAIESVAVEQVVEAISAKLGK